MSLGTMVVKNGATFQFAVCEFDNGTVPDFNELSLEELTDPGVTGRRWRQVYRQYRPFGLRTAADCATYAAGKTLLSQYQDSLGQIAKTLTVSLSGVTYIFPMVKITAVAPVLKRGTMVGDGATGTGLAVLYCQWSMVLTGFTS